MHIAAAHGAQRLTVQRWAGGLRFEVDHMDAAAEASGCGRLRLCASLCIVCCDESGERAVGAVTTCFKAKKAQLKNACRHVQDEICAIADPKQAITVHDTCIAFDLGATDDCFSSRTALPG